jgi:NADH-quinone oxidoreductase subunit F
MPEHRLLLKDIDIPDIDGIEAYLNQGGYQGAAKAVEMSQQQLLEHVDASGLRGRGGGWEPVAQKWRRLPQSATTRYLCVNAYDADPGLFRDRKLIERVPHRILEGIIIAARAVGAHVAYLCIRGELARPAAVIHQALEEAYQANWLGTDVAGSGFDLDVFVHPGGGAHIAGEETALLQGLAGGRPEPSVGPSSHTLFGEPAIVHNVGTLAYLPEILAAGASEFRKVGTTSFPGTCVFCVSGHVRRPGLYELALGSTTLRQLIEDYAGGVLDGRALKAVIVGGTLSTVLQPDQLDVALDPQKWAIPGAGPIDGAFGNGAIIVLDDTTCMVETAIQMMRFYAAESCGQCAPCREGSGWILQLLERLEEGVGDLDEVKLIESVALKIGPRLRPEQSTALCGFGSAFAWTVQNFLHSFGAEFEAHATAAACSMRESKESGFRVPDSVSVRY